MPTIGRHWPRSAPRGEYTALCDVCGVLYRRSQLIRKPGGGLACSGPGTLDDARGRDEVELSRANAAAMTAAAARRRSRPKLRGGASESSESTPETILGSALHTWLLPSRHHAMIDHENRVTEWFNLGRTGNPTAVGALRPRYDRDGFNDFPCMVANRSHRMSCTLTTTLAAGSRPYLWVVGQFDATDALGDLVRIQRPSGYAAMAIFVSASGLFTAQATVVESSAGNTVDTCVATADTSAHLFEYGMLATRADRFFVDGVGYDGSQTEAVYAESDELCLFGISARTALSLSATTTFSGKCAEVVIASSLPSAEQITAMRDYFTDRELGLTIAA
jgi:hypothetical protein